MVCNQDKCEKMVCGEIMCERWCVKKMYTKDVNLAFFNDFNQKKLGR